MVLVTPQKFVCLLLCFMQCWYMYTIHCERELMVLVTPQKMKNLPRSDPDTRPLPKLDIALVGKAFPDIIEGPDSYKGANSYRIWVLCSSDLVIQAYTMAEGVSSTHFHSLVSSHWTSHWSRQWSKSP